MREARHQVESPLTVQEADELWRGAESNLDADRTLARIESRLTWAQQAADLEKLRAAAEKAESAANDFAHAERERRGKADVELARLRIAIHRASNAFAEALTAHEELLGTAEPHADGC